MNHKQNNWMAQELLEYRDSLLPRDEMVLPSGMAGMEEWKAENEPTMTEHEAFIYSQMIGRE